MKTYRNTRFTCRDYECTNVVACVSDTPPNDNWIECDASTLDGLMMLWIQNGVRYYGWL